MAEYECASCENRVCREGIDCYNASERVKQLYTEADPLSVELMQAAAKIEAEGYMQWPRALEIIRFAQKIGFTHLGVAFCIGLCEEANTYVDFLKMSFDVSSVCCKVCGISKSEFQLPEVRPGESNETMCSPLGQAELLNDAGTQLNIMMGLCVGHDALFTQQSKAPVTTLVVKDRVLAHNPCGALYSRYWRKVLKKMERCT